MAVTFPGATGPGAAGPPAMSVVLVTPDDYGVIRRTVHALARQTVRNRLELLIAAPSRERLALPVRDVADFHTCRVVEVGDIKVLTRAKVAAVIAASAPLIAFAEDHCFPEPGWAEALIASFGNGHAAVGPLMRNANPDTSVSWAGLFLHFGCCMQPIRHAGCTALPWHNTAYRRDTLLAYGPRLTRLLMVEGFLQDDLRANGGTLGFQPEARTDHVNISLLSSWMKHAFWGGRLFGATRARHLAWPRWKRLVYMAAFPLIPVVRLRRMAKRMREVGDGARFPRLLPAMLAGLVPHAVGEFTGYAFGMGRAEERYSSYEMKRYLHVVARDVPRVID